MLLADLSKHYSFESLILHVVLFWVGQARRVCWPCQVILALPVIWLFGSIESGRHTLMPQISDAIQVVLTVTSCAIFHLHPQKRFSEYHSVSIKWNRLFIFSIITWSASQAK